jgi:hypothetical protein
MGNQRVDFVVASILAARLGKQRVDFVVASILAVRLGKQRVDFVVAGVRWEEKLETVLPPHEELGSLQRWRSPVYRLEQH